MEGLVFELSRGSAGSGSASAIVAGDEVTGRSVAAG
jgi:hypothetical protein